MKDSEFAKIGGLMSLFGFIQVLLGIYVFPVDVPIRLILAGALTGVLGVICWVGTTPSSEEKKEIEKSKVVFDDKGNLK